MKKTMIKAMCLLAFLNGQAKAGATLDLATQNDFSSTHTYEQLDAKFDTGNGA